MSEIKKDIPQELNMDELEQVAGGWNSAEVQESMRLALKDRSCYIPGINEMVEKNYG